MRRVLLVAAAAIAAACGPRASAPSGSGRIGEAGAPEATAPDHDALVGDYECRFTRAHTEQPPAPCAIRAAQDASLHFEQPGGAIRLGGTVTPDEAGFRLAADITCEVEPCPAPGAREVVFFTQRPGAFAAVVPLSSGELLDIDVQRR